MTIPLDLQEAQDLILEQTGAIDRETVELREGLGRISASDIRSPRPRPGFNTSLRDGYVITAFDLEKLRGGQGPHLKIRGEVVAGCSDLLRVSPGETIRITTGAPVPRGGCQVLPFEHCRTDGDFIIPYSPLPDLPHIKKRGADAPQNTLLLKAGVPIEAEHLAMLAEAGNTRIPVFQRPQIAILCTGSELIAPNHQPRHGQVVNSNRFLLDGLVRQAGGLPVGLDNAADDLGQICGQLRPMLSSGVIMVVTTGGMGPGKYDLTAQAVERLGGRILYRSLNMRPGKATLFAIIDDVLLFGLPGPPPAVRLLFSELVRPAIRKAQGCSNTLPNRHRAELSESVILKRNGLLHLRGGRLSIRQHGMAVRPARQTEPVNCIMALPPHRRNFKAGEKIWVHTDPHASV